ncbi:unnamed protein product, partial [Didymodactylos carnosus]
SNEEEELKLEELDMNTCSNILTEMSYRTKQFQGKLEWISKEWKTIKLREIMWMFDGIDRVEEEMQLLTPFLDDEARRCLPSIMAYWRDQEFIQNVCKGCQKIVQLYNLDTNPIPIDKILAITDETLCETCHVAYQEFSNVCYSKQPKPVLAISSHFYSSIDLIEFLATLNRTDFDDLLEAITEWDESSVSPQTIIEFQSIGSFLGQLLTYFSTKQTSSSLSSTSTKKSINEFFQQVNKLLKNSDFANIVNCFQSCSLSLIGIKRLYLELTDKEESKRIKIFHIINNSTINFSHSVKFDVFVQTKNGEKLSYVELTELRDRARLIEYSGNEKKAIRIQQREYDEETEKKMLKSLVVLTDVIENVLQNLRELDIMGYPCVEQYTKSDQTFTCNKGDFSALDKFLLFLQEIRTIWEQKLVSSYELYHDLTYLCGQQIWRVEEALINYRTLNKQHPGYHLLQYIGLENLTTDISTINLNLSAQERLEVLGKLLNSQRIHPQPPEVFENVTSNDTRSKKLFVVETSVEGLYRGILSLMRIHEAGNINLNANRLLFCTEQTNWMEIRAFLYRCFCSPKTLHELVEPEQLPFPIQDKCCRLINEFDENYPHHQFLLGIVTTDIQTHLINGLLRTEIAKIVRDSELLNEGALAQLISTRVKNCHLISSKLTGLGKSFHVAKYAERESRVLLKFPITGDLIAEDIAQQLLLHSQTYFNKPTVVHFHIGTVDNIHLLNSILFSLCLFRSCSFSQTVVHVPLQTVFFFELESSAFWNLQQSVFIFRFLPVHNLTKVDFNELLHTRPDIQFVSKYLDAIETQIIEQQDVDVNKSKVMDSRRCIELLNKYFIQQKDQQYLTWTQLNIFTLIFSSLFDGFSKCGYFRVDALDNPKLRMDIIQAFIASSNQFTSLSVKSVRERQSNSGDNIYDPGKVLSESIIRWDKTQPFTVVFTSTSDPLFVYKSPRAVPESLIQYFNALSKRSAWFSNATNDVFKDFTKLTHTELFYKLASLSTKYWNKAICTKCFRQFPHEQRLCSECKDSLTKPKTFDSNDVRKLQTEIANILEREYVITPDNYIKMLLIWLRVSSRLPVLIMGETG